MQAALGVDDACDAALREIFGDTASATAQLDALLDMLGVARHPAAYGIGALEWARIVDHAFDGARGRNFIGTRALPASGLQPGAARTGASLTRNHSS